MIQFKKKRVRVNTNFNNQKFLINAYPSVLNAKGCLLSRHPLRWHFLFTA